MSDFIEPQVSPLLRAIDVHGHYGVYVRDNKPIYRELMTGLAAEVSARARAVNIEWTVVSPLTSLLPRGRADAVAGNQEALEIIPKTPGLLQWVVVNPLQPESYDQAAEMLTKPHCMGIKIHPEEHCYPIKEHGRALLEFAARHRAVVLTHSGEANSLPADFVPFMNELPEATLILAHIGASEGDAIDLQVRAVQASKHGNIYADTSSARSVWSGLIEWAVREAGADRVLFGSDTPLYSAAAQRARVDCADLTVAQKERVLVGNARRLLRIPA
ncbi:MAG TPA: amidohydrolase family protein [Opitutaceae bacterium]|nr:amidohydrolase family protein [Opitutaceae bacterium]